MSDTQEQSESTLPAQPEPVSVSGAPSSAGAQGAPVAPAGGRGQMAATAQPRRGTVRSIHYTLSYIVQDADRGPRGAIVLLHDFPGGAFAWADVLPRLAGTGRAVYAFDMLGYGQSERPWPSDTSIWGQADCLLYALEALRLTDVVLVGFGLGGAVAQVLATRLGRNRVARLVLIDSYGYMHAFAPDWPLPEMTKRRDAEAPKHTPLDQMLAELRATIPQAAANPTHLSGSKLSAYVDEWNSEVGKELLFQHARLMIPGYVNAVSSNLKTLAIPVLLIWGERDAVTPVALAERMRHEIPDARLEIVRNAGHLVLDDAPEAVGALVADFAGARG